MDIDLRIYQAAYLLAQHADRYPNFYRDRQGKRCECLGQVVNAIVTNNLLQETPSDERRMRPLHNQSI